MSAEDYSPTSSDAQSNMNDRSSLSGNGDSEPPGIRSQHSNSLSHWRTESFFLALLFALVAMLLPAFFSLATPPSPEEPRKGDLPLQKILPYLPTVATVLRISLSLLRVFLRPLIRILSLISAILAPIFLTINFLYRIFLLLPFKMIREVVRFLYPVYVLCGVACLFGAGVGIGSRLFIKGGKALFVQNGYGFRKGKQRIHA